MRLELSSVPPGPHAWAMGAGPRGPNAGAAGLRNPGALGSALIGWKPGGLRSGSLRHLLNQGRPPPQRASLSSPHVTMCTRVGQGRGTFLWLFEVS